MRFSKDAAAQIKKSVVEPWIPRLLQILLNSAAFSKCSFLRTISSKAESMSFNLLNCLESGIPDRISCLTGPIIKTLPSLMRPFNLEVNSASGFLCRRTADQTQVSTSTFIAFWLSCNHNLYQNQHYRTNRQSPGAFYARYTQA